MEFEELFERSKHDGAFIAGSEVRQVIGELRRARRANSELARAIVSKDKDRDFRSISSADKMIGGSDVCATCEAHCVVMIEDEENDALWLTRAANGLMQVYYAQETRILDETCPWDEPVDA